LDLHVVPVFPKRAENSAVVGHVAIPVGGAFPDAHRRKMRRLQAANVPLINAVIGNAVQSDFTVGPWLCTGPFDAVVKVLGLTRGKTTDVAGLTSAAARIRAYASTIVRYPFFRVDDFPALIEVRPPGSDIRMLNDHTPPRTRVAVLKSQSLGIRP